MKKFLPLLLLSSLGITKLSAQVTGTKTIGVDYTTLAAAITDLNTVGISGNVVINIPTGYTETAPSGGYLLGSATLNGSTSATSTLTIQKSGTTANPVLTAPVGTSATVDGIFFIQGTDYVTIDGIDITEASGNTTATTQMEFGYALVKMQSIAPFDGCQNVTIKNCTVTLTILNTTSVGIYSGNHIAASTTALTITATTDAMNNCVFSSNTVQNCNTAIKLNGYAGAPSPYTLYDQNNTIGGGAIAGNTLQNYGGNGVVLQYQNNDVITYNTINNIAGGGTVGTGGGVGVNVGTATNASVNVSNNTINLAIGATSGNTYGIYINSAGTGAVTLNANALTASGGGTGGFYMIFFASGNTNLNVTNNNFNNINVATTGILALIYHSAAASVYNMYCNGNYTSGTTTPYVTKTGAGGTFYGYYNAVASTSGTSTISNNNISNINLASATFIGIYESNANTVNAGVTKYVSNNVVSNITTGGVSAAANYGIAVGGAATQNISNCVVSNMNVGAGNGYALYHWACTIDTIRNCRVNGLTSTGGNVYGITTTNSSTLTRIYGDTLNGLSTTFSTGIAYGLYQSGAATAEIYKNTVYDIAATGSGGSAYGLYLASASNTVWNNLVADIRTPNYTTATANSGTQLVGIYCGAGTAYNIYYNTVHLNATSTGANFGSSAVYAATGNTTFNNNIFINNSIPAGTGMVAAYRRSATGLTGYLAASNNNLFYAGTPATNKAIMYDATTAYQTLAAYKTLVTPRDVASVTDSVVFQSVTGGTAGFLKPDMTVATQAESNGINIAGITDDIYNAVRAGNAGYADTGVAPDLGAIEANYTPLDFSAPSITYTLLTTACSTGNRTLTATITDVTGVPVSGALKPRIYYKKGSGSWFSSAGTLASGTNKSGTWNFTIVAADMSGIAGGDIISYFVIAQDSASTPNLTSNPIGVSATDVNTISTYPATPNGYPVGYASGTFNVGAGQTFATITAAANSYNSNTCLTGPVTFLLTDAAYPSETFPITIGNNPLASSAATLMIRPAVTTTVTGSGAPVFSLDGARYVTIDGRIGSTGTTKSLTISNTTTNAADIRFINGASNDTLKYCTLMNVNTATNTGTLFFSTSTGTTGNSNNLIDNCDFIPGSTPYVQGIYSSGTTGKENINNTISNCNFADVFSASVATCGINLGAATSDWTISNNRFYQTTAKTYTTANTHRSILISNTSGNGFTVSNNVIGYASASGTGTYSMGGTTVATTFRGIDLTVGTTTPSSVQGNTLTNMSLSSTTGTITGILVSGGSVNVGTVAGNTIGSGTATGAITITNTTSSSNLISGINTSAASPAIVNIQNNTIGGITVTGSATVGAGMTGIFASSSAAVTISGNTIGSTTTANSMNSSAVTTGSVAINAYGINSSLTSASTISNNTIANLNCASTSTLAFVAGLIHTGSGALTISGNTIRNISGAGATTQLTGQVGVNGIAITGGGAVTVSQNTIYTISNANAGTIQSNVVGIGLITSANSSILRNKIYDLRNASTMTTATTPPTAIGIQINNAGGTSTTIANNMISLGNGQTTNTEFMGIMNNINTTSALKVFHNSINIEGTASSGALPTMGFNRGNFTTTAVTTSIEFKNNIIRNARTGGTGKHYAIVNGLLVAAGSATGWGAGLSNNNILNAAASTVGFWSTDQTLAGWKTASAGDNNSYNGVSLTFTNTSTGDLHMNMGTTPNYIESHGTAVAVINDYDNDNRPGPTGSVNGGGIIPDLGADEFDGVSIDDVAPAITYTILPTTCSTGDRTLAATIVDQSGVPAASSGTEPRIYYKKGLLGTWYSRPGTLSSGTVTNGIWSFPIVGTDMGGIAPADRVYYYVVAQDVMTTPNVGASPAIGFAATSVISITTPPTTPSNYFVSYASGTFNVGVGQPFTTITEAVNSYNTNTCLTGPVTFLLTDAAYSTSETYPITITNNPLANSTVKLTIKPATGVAATVTGSSSAASVFKLLNAQYVTIDGVNTGGASLSLINSNTGSNTAVVWLASTATTGPGNKNVSLLNMNMTGGVASSTTNWGIAAVVDGATPTAANGIDNDSITVQGNSIKKCGYTLWLAGNAATAAGGLNGWVIKNNLLGPTVYSTTDNPGINGTFMRNMTDVVFSGNTLQNIGLTTVTSAVVGMYFEGGIDGMVIDSNIVDTVVANTTATFQVCAFYFNTGNKNVTISRNKITAMYNVNTGGYGARGIVVTNGTPASNFNIVNNFISDVVNYSSTALANWAAGISVDGTSGGVNIYNNSINLSGPHTGLTTATGSAAIIISSTGTGFDVRNNLLVNSYENTSSTTDKTYAIYSTAASTAFTNIDYNNYYTTGGSPKLGFIGGADRPTLTDMITGFGGNTHSINEPAPFVSSTDLHIPTSTVTPLESAGIPITGITTDIDNQVRPGPAGSTYGGGTIPDIGADEFDGVPIDGSAPLVSYTALSTSTCATGNRIVSGVTISDFTGIPTTGSTMPKIYFKKNSGSWVSDTGTLTSGTAINGIWSFTISATALGGLTGTDVVSYYVIAQDIVAIPNVGAFPGAGLVASDVNTVTTAPTTPYTYTVIPTLSGTYTVGSGGAYPTLTAAVNTYNTACLAGNVTFLLTDANYSTGETFPIVIRNNTNAGASTTLTIKPQTGVAATVTGSSGAASVIKLLNARFVTIDGVNTGGCSLTLNNSNAGSNTAVVWLASTATTGPGNKNISLLNMNMNGGSNTTVSNWGIIAGVDGTTPTNTNGLDNDSVTVQGNYIKKCGYSLYLMGTAATAAGGLNGWVIKNNILGPSTYSATENLCINGAFMRNMTNVIFSGNTLQNIGHSTITSAVVGIYFETGIDGMVIDSNIVDTVVANTTSGYQVCAFYFNTGNKNVTISRNKITAMYNVNTGGYGARGITVNTGVAASNFNIVNNFISDVVNYSSATVSNLAAGIGVDGTSGGINIYNNSINLYGSHPGLTTATSSADIVIASTGGNIDVRNNLLINSYDNTSSSTDKTYAIYSSVANTMFTNVDYNDYYVTGGTGMMGYIGGTDRPALTDMVTGFGGNANSINSPALFMTPTDLHLQPFSINLPLIAGTSLGSVTTDIDGNTRATTPVIGADETNIPPCSGAPTPGSVTASVLSNCGAFNSNLTLTGSSTGAGLQIQWQSSADSSTWTSISGATSLTYSPAVSAITYYRATVTCTISSLSDSTPGVPLVVYPIPAITGPAVTCAGGIITLSATPGGGTWASGTTSIVTIDPSSGVATGVAMGSAPITYTSLAGCTTVGGVAVVSTPSIPVITPATATICEGESVPMTASATYSGLSGTVNSGTISVAVPDNSVAGASSTLSVGLPAGAIITGASVKINATMPYTGDWSINLTAPNGNTLNLFNRHGTTANFANTIVSSTGTTTFTSGTPPYTGTFAATAASGSIGITGYPVNVTTWPALYSAPNGIWRLSLRDFLGGYTGTLTSWSLTVNYSLPSDITWSPTATLYTSSDLSTPYTGTVTNSVYAQPSAPGTVATVNTYTATASVPGCSLSNPATAVVTVNPLPSPIVGSNTVCHGLVTTLSNPDAGGSWTSTNATDAPIGATSGIVDGVNPGTSTISYTFTGTGCVRSMVMTVNALPDPITGTASVCQAATTTLADATGLGTWVSDAPSIASVDASTGVVTGGAAGLAMISYVLPTTCMQTKQVTVNPLPVLNIAPASSATICEGDSASFTASSPLIEFPVLSQNFNEPTLGSWTISNLSGDPANVWQVTSSPFSTTTGDGTPMLESAPSAGATSAVQTILTSPGFSTVGFGSAVLAFNEYLYSIVGSDIKVAVEYSIDNGSTWTTLLDQLGAIVDPATWSAASPQITVALPSAALNVPNVKLRWNYDSYGVSWALDNIYVKGALPAATFTWAGVGSADGLSCTACAASTITPTVPGANVYSVTANSTCSTTGSVTVNMNALPDITGTSSLLCTGKTIALGSTTSGGTWTSSDNMVATVDAATGAITGVATGSVVITYTLPTSCARMVTLNVNQSPDPITGTLHVCETLTTALGNAIGGGTWSSADLSVATIDPSAGITTGVVAGTSTISYIMPSGCFVTANATVDPLPVITGSTGLLCTGSTITLASSIAGGAWVSADNTVATVDASGVVTGVTAGSVVISYTLPTTCGAVVTLSVNQAPDPISGSLHVCETATTTLGNAIGSGTWSSTDLSVATIDLLTGVTTGVAPGTTTISYIMSSGCFVTANATVNPLPSITGATSLLCTGHTITLGSTISGGTWVSSDNTVATVDASGVVSGHTAGIVVVSYTLPTTCGAVVTLNVNQNPGPISGSLHICEGLTTALGNTVLGGSWSSSDLTVAIINSASGLTTAVAPGTSIISYTMPSGCQVTDVATVDQAPTAFTGGLAVCEGLTITLGTTPTGGTWVSDAPAIADVDMTTGVVTGIASGTANITYTSSTGCQRTEVATVNALPVDIAGSTAVCQGLTTTLVNTTGGGSWNSSDMTVATVDAGGVVSGLTPGTTVISYTLTATGCYKTKIVTVNALPNPIPGPIAVCEGLTTTLSNTPVGGTWISDNLTVATIDATTGVMSGLVFGTTNITYTLPTGCISTAVATVNPLPVTTTGTLQVCVGLTTNLVNTTGGGTWYSDNVLVAGIDATGMVTGNTVGTANILYTLPTGCLNSVIVTVNPLPNPISAPITVCEGLTTTVTNTTPDGTWSSSAPLTASIDAMTGVMTGMAAGNATITYTLATSCIRVADATVNALPSAITGVMDVCAGSTTTLFNTTPGGTWSNDASGNATVASTGIVNGVVGGTASISYTIGTGCMRSAEVTVSVLPTAYGVTGGGGYCAGTSGAIVGLANSDLNVNYDLYQGSTFMGSSLGTGAAISFGAQSAIGTYTVFATHAITSCVNDMAGSVAVSITPVSIPVVTLSTAATTVCSGVAITYTATPVNGGTLPVYNWEINGSPVSGATAATYSYNPSNGDIVKVTLNSNEICAVPSMATDLLTMTVNTSEMPVATISTPNLNVCAGSGATFTVIPGFGGTAPSYEWFVNSMPTGATSMTYAYAPNNGDVVTCKMASNFTCRMADTVTSNSLTITATPIALPIVSLSVSPSAVFLHGTTVTFTATVSGVGGATPSYKWLVNGVLQAGATGATFTSDSLNNNDSVTCKVNVSVPCGFENFNSIVVKVKQVGVSQVFGAGNIMLVPNPNQGDFTVKGTVASESDEEVFVEVVDMLGQIVYKGHTATRNGALNERIKLSNTLANGMYMLNLRTATETAVFHFVLEQ